MSTGIQLGGISSLYSLKVILPSAIVGKEERGQNKPFL